MTSLILASSSSARSALLQRLGLPFNIAIPDLDETSLPDEHPEALALRLAPAKAQKVASLHPDSLIIGSDLVATINGQIFSKPSDKDEAFAQLKFAGGKVGIFYTAVSLFNSRTLGLQTKVVTTEAHYRKLSDSMIQHYIEKDNPVGCGGSCKVESLGISLFDKVLSSDPTALIGLPLIALTKMLEQEGMRVI